MIPNVSHSGNFTFYDFSDYPEANNTIHTLWTQCTYKLTCKKERCGFSPTISPTSGPIVVLLVVTRKLFLNSE